MIVSAGSLLPLPGTGARGPRFKELPMRTLRAFSLVLVLAACPVVAAEIPQGKLIRDTWEAAYLEGAKSGYVHTTVREVERTGERLFRTAAELHLTIKRDGALVQLRMETGSEETPAGKVTGVSMTQYLDGGRRFVVTGTVEGKQLHVTSNDGSLDKRVGWNDQVIGLYRQERIFQDRRAKPGDQFTYLSYEPTITRVATFHVSVKDEEEVELLRVKQRLLRVEAVPEKIKLAGDNSVALPTMTTWLDNDLLPVRTQTEIPGLGTIVLYRTTRAVALRPSDSPSEIRDLLLTTLIPVNKAIPRPYETREVVYRITVKGDENPKTAFAQDERQKIIHVNGRTVDLRVRARREPQPLDRPGQVKDEFLKSCYFINSDDPRVQALARQAVQAETDPWKKAQRIEGWVHEHMERNNAVSFATAGQVARRLQGDCRQHAMLTAAMCRAAGVPSRTAVGLIYVNDVRRRPVMAFHMWTEVWVAGQWLGLDSTLGRGSVGAGHLKIADHSWHDTQSLTPILPVMRVLGKVAIDIVDDNGGE
jgi:transglutaminase-like putative cysteine protease